MNYLEQHPMIMIIVGIFGISLGGVYCYSRTERANT